MNFIHKFNDLCIKVVQTISLLLLFLLTISTMTGVIYRYVLKSPIIWLYEFVVLIFAWLVFSGVVMAYSRGENINLTFLMNSLNEKGRLVLKTVIDLINMIFICMIIYFGFQIVKSTASQSYQTINVSLGWFYASFPVMGIPMIVTIIDRSIRRFENIETRN